jgi:hypothetical protein
VRLSLGVTGHREANPLFREHRDGIAAAFGEVLDGVSQTLSGLAEEGTELEPTRLHTLLADGADQLAAEAALARGWELVAPLPFGRRLNAAINARPEDAAGARALISGRRTTDAEARARANAILKLSERARVFELADRDAEMTEAFIEAIGHPGDHLQSQRFAAEVAARVALASRVMVEQTDILIAVWDGLSRDLLGGTGHTIAVALDCGCPVLWIDARAPHGWRLLRTPESLAAAEAPTGTPLAELAAIVRAAIAPSDAAEAAANLAAEAWRPHSHPLSHGYRRVEALFGGGGRPFRRLRQTYETPDAVADGSGAAALAAIRDLPGGDPALPKAIEAQVMRRFAWADGVSSHLSDIYRGGMTANFVLSAASVLSGVVYLPFMRSDQKTPFAAAEFALLVAILVVTGLGQRRRWHGRWFETRRVAEYLRHSPILLALGVARPPGRWLRGSDTSWPESYARRALREVGLPSATVTAPYLRGVLDRLLRPHVGGQRDYHAAKAVRLTTVHHNLDRLSAAAFVLAVIAVAGFLALDLVEAAGVIPEDAVTHASKWFTLLGVALPTLGAAIAGVRYFGDFERFAAISEITAEKLAAVDDRIGLLLQAPDASLDYARVADLAHEADDIVVTEIERWQSVFGGKHVTVPV